MAAAKEQIMRSEKSLKNDAPVIPEKMERFEKVLKKGFFVVKPNKNWVFYW